MEIVGLSVVVAIVVVGAVAGGMLLINAMVKWLVS